jgi:hypothetical protein
MPTKRTPRVRRPLGQLTPALVDVLLTGESAADPFLEFDITEAQRLELWDLHGEALRAEARRRGIVIPDAR